MSVENGAIEVSDASSRRRGNGIALEIELDVWILLDMYSRFLSIVIKGGLPFPSSALYSA
ncbi:hypothetical protein AO726_03680 [Pseudomonas sp. TTU2014-080ASC]|nr:hypothetical protein AO726_03680 [Pseudomonas sp. TTU2014-080ASC]